MNPLRFQAWAGDPQDVADEAVLQTLNKLAQWVNSKGYNGLAQDMLDTFGVTDEKPEAEPDLFTASAAHPVYGTPLPTAPKPPGPANDATLMEGER